jgi:hypothetical protein
MSYRKKDEKSASSEATISIPSMNSKWVIVVAASSLNELLLGKS